MPGKWMKKLKGDNRGSAIVSVVVAMVFILALSAALLFSAYAAYQMKIAQRADLENFYDATSAMDEIKAGVQRAVSESISEAYAKVLEEYPQTGSSASDPEGDFKRIFIEKLREWRNNDGHDELIYNGYGNPKTFEAFLSHQESVEIACGQVVEDENSLTFKDISVKHSARGYESSVTSDIVVTKPGVYAGGMAPSDLNKYAIIANQGIIASGNASITGEVFAGSGGITVGNSGSTLTLSGGSVITTGSLLVGQGAELFANNANYSLWTREISLENSGKLRLDTSAYVADDLVLNAGSSATIRGRYFGFGSNVAGDNGSSGASSSIFVNSLSDTLDPAKLDISGAGISLAGVSYVDISGSDGAADQSYSLPMGQSLSVKSDQLAYLVPENCLSVVPPDDCQVLVSGNPMVFKGNKPAVTVVETLPSLWGDKTLANYFSGAVGTKTLMTNLNSAEEPLWMMYTFLEFNDQAKANQYFTDYFKAYPDRISQYLETYLKLANGSVAQGAGVTYTTDGKGELNLKDADTISAEGAQNRYKVICSDSYSPFNTYIDDERLRAVDTAAWFKDSNNNTTLVKVENNPYANAYTVQTDETAKLIITSKNVIVPADCNYEGIIIAGGTVTVNGSVTATALNADVLNAYDEIIKLTLAETGILKGVTGTGEVVPAPTNTNAWDPDLLVNYQNWSKH